MLEIEKLVVQRGGKTVVHGVDLRVMPGAITALLGPNGAGKSSLVMAVAGVLPVQSGRVMFQGKPLHKQRPERIRQAGISVVPEGHRVLGDLSVHDNLRVAAVGLPKAHVAPAVAQALAWFPELSEKLHDPAACLSGGQKQMVCIAQALMTRPRLLILDELSLGLAPVVVKRLADVICAVVAQEGVGVLLIEQFTTLALGIAQHACVLERGSLVYTGSAHELRESPDILHDSYFAADVSALPRPSIAF